jgi:hypothetical protein
MDEVAQIRRLGWDWRSDGMGLGLGPGVLLCVNVNGKTLRAFVPLSHVWLAFDSELQSVGCVGSQWVGAPFSVGGFFSFIKKAAKSLGSAAKKVVPKAIQRAASKVVATAKHYGGAAWSAIKKVPVLGAVASATAALALLPANAASQLVQGKRIDKIALGQFKTALGSVKTLAPYVQTVVSFVPGVGQGISAGLGASLALAQGQSISNALIAAARGAIPGGPMAAAAFDVATAVAQGKPLDQVALNALPISPSAKAALVQGLHAAKALANGQNVAQVAIDTALHQLPPAAQKAVQIGVALGHAKNLQDAAGAAARGAVELASTSKAGSQAAAAFARGVRTPAVMTALQRAAHSQNALATVVRHAQAGHPQANRVVNALQMMRRSSRPVPQFGAFSRA